MSRSFRIDDRVWWRTTDTTIARGTVRELEDRPGVQPDGETDLLYLDAEQLHQAFVPGVYRPGQPGYIEPGTPDWLQAITPSKVAAILGISRWESPYRLWHRAKGLIEPEPPKDLFTIGHDLEPFAANRWKRKNPGWRVSTGEVQFILPDDRFGFPVICTLDRRASRGRARRVLELKCARTLADVEQWGDDLTGDAPEDYTSQVLAQMIFTGWTEYDGHLTAIGPYYNDRIYTVEYDPEVATWMLGECRTFYESLSADSPPPLDDSVACYQTVRELHPDIAPGTSTQIDPHLAFEYLTSLADHKANEVRVRAAKTKILAAMGDTESAVVGELPVARRAPHASGSVALTASRKTNPADLAAMVSAEDVA